MTDPFTARFSPLAIALAIAAANPEPNARAQPPDDKEMGRRLQEELRQHGADVHGCYAVALAGKPGLAGEALFRIHVATDGSVARAELLKDDTQNGKLTDCLVGAMGKWQLKSLAGTATQQFVFPLIFKPEEAPARRAPTPTATPPAATRYVVPLSEGRPGPRPGNRIVARVLIEPGTVGPTQASLTRLELRQTVKLQLHSHPSLELLYVVKGLARVRDAFGGYQVAEAGDLIVLPANQGHSIEAAPLAPLDLLQVFVPAGPEEAYLDSSKRSGTLPAKKEKGPPPGIVPSVVKAGGARSLPLVLGAAKGTVALMLDGNAAVGPAASFQRYEADAGAEVPPHQHETADELLWVVSGKATLSLGGQEIPVAAGDAVHIPKAVKHSLKVSERLGALQIYAPAGPEQRFKAPPPQGTPTR